MAQVLIVDDLDELREFLCDLLTESGHTVVSATNGSEGVECARNSKFDLLITDIFMPEMDGIELIRLVSQLQPNVPIIAISAGDRRGRTDTLEFAEDFGADRIFVKPFDVSKFLIAVNELLAQKETE